MTLIVYLEAATGSLGAEPRVAADHSTMARPFPPRGSVPKPCGSGFKLPEAVPGPLTEMHA